jgi:hypothetical protein
MAPTQPYCIYCERTSSEVPLIPLIFQDGQIWICPQHLPVLIHHPAQLASKLPGIENLGAPPDHED